MLPIEIKAGLVKNQAIDTMVAAMQGLASKRGILITSSQVQEEIRKMANTNNILLIEGVSSEEDLIRGLKDAKIIAKYSQSSSITKTF